MKKIEDKRYQKNSYGLTGIDFFMTLIWAIGILGLTASIFILVVKLICHMPLFTSSTGVKVTIFVTCCFILGFLYFTFRGIGIDRDREARRNHTGRYADKTESGDDIDDAK